MSNLPIVSCIVPYYNRIEFLPQLFNTFEKQTYKDFELIIIDDGSNDGSDQFIENYIKRSPLNIVYARQSNAGPYVARNKGLRLAQGKFIAFQDSDDEWPEYHLEKMVDYFKQCPQADWIFGGIKRIDHDSGETVNENTFHIKSGPHPILGLKKISHGNVSLLDDSDFLNTCIEHGLPCGTQSSIFRREIFDSLLYDESYFTGYDRFFTIRVILKQFKVGYVNEIHQIYHIHNNHISLVADSSPTKIIKNTKNLIRGYEEILILLKDKPEAKAIKSRLSELYAWQLSLNLQKTREYKAASKAMATAIRYNPLNLFYIKSYIACQLKRIYSSLQAATSSSSSNH